MRYLNYQTRYSYALSYAKKRGKQESTIEHTSRDVQDCACFSNLFGVSGAIKRENSNPIITTELDIYIATGKASYSKNKSNFLMLNEEDMIFWLEYIKQVIDYNYTLTKEDSYYKISVTGSFKEVQLKILATLIRYLYEADYNFCLAEAIAIYKLGSFPGENLFNLYSVVATTRLNIGSGHGHLDAYNVYPLLTIEQYKERASTVERVNDWILPTPHKGIALERPLRTLVFFNIKEEFARLPFSQRFDIYKPENVQERVDNYYKFAYALMADPSKEGEPTEFMEFLKNNKLKSPIKKKLYGEEHNDHYRDDYDDDNEYDDDGDWDDDDDE